MLVKRAENQNTTFKIEFEGDELIVFWVAALNNYQLKDFKLLATVELPLESSPAILNFLISLLSQPGINEEYQFEDYIWKARWVDANIELTLFEDMEIIDKFLLPTDRHSIWLAALKVILNKVTENLGEVAVNQNYAMLPGVFDDKIHYIWKGERNPANPLGNKGKAMVEKLIKLSETQEQTLKSLAQTLSVSEEELIQKVLTEFINSQNIKNQPSPSKKIESFLHRAQKISEQHHLPQEYRFNRDEIYEE